MKGWIESDKRFNKGKSKKCNKECRKWMNEEWLGKHIIQCFRHLTYHTCVSNMAFFFFSVWVFFHEHSQFTGLQGKGEAISLSPLYHFYLLHRHLDISWAITAESSPLHIASSQTLTGNLWFPSASR